MGWADLLIIQGLENFADQIDDWTSDWPAVVRGLIFIALILVIFWALWGFYEWWGVKGYLWVLAIWVILEIAHLLGGGHSR